ncbi:hypothetical protein KBC79_04910 [Candidatus Woesebacteria bacterium]|nr:hypothetical protein [Candidatus Woesebacteria bacterium]
MSGEIPSPFPENEVALSPGMNVLVLPDFTKPFQDHPMYISSDGPSRIPLSPEEVRKGLEKFFKSIEAQGGQILGMPVVAVTENMEEVTYSSNAKVVDRTFVIVKR